ncbi:DUF998 domain-containing protein [Nocardia crassostreae]|uniref:DUF998 domain-containing protein n=1 Tax=Nocardia crassostreae TaxID=53428 RepID=UPI0009FE1E63|nr:DUF998 domain-containing protein [Nocardia crassostreae]
MTIESRAGANPPAARLNATSALLAGGLIAGPLFTLVYTVEGAMREHYSAMRNSVSSLALGPSGWVQSVNFLVCGVLTLGFAIGLRKVFRGSPGGVWGPAGVGLFAVGVIVAGVFATDPESGYPPGSPVPFPEAAATTAGFLHNLSVRFGFPGFVLGCCVCVRLFLARGERGWAAVSAAAAALFVVAAQVSFRGFGRLDGLGRWAGFFERVTATTAFLWMALVAAGLLTNRIRCPRSRCPEAGHAPGRGSGRAY